ncbi:MAG: Gfo/Idh/MocA family oxidoreductase [Chloroflexota bacterium]|nr:Gfo/Idh/MocA family oxidoreductase [Chloroflexota bacterium]
MAIGKKPSVGAAFVGCAHIHTPNFVKRLQNRRDVRVLAVWDHDHARAQKTADVFGAPVTQLDAVWSNDDIAAVIICAETNRHPELVAAAAAAGKHLFVEKPLAITGRDAFALAEAIERAGVRFQTGYFMRGQPINRFVREQIQRGSFGTLTRIRASNCHSGALKGWFDAEWGWMADPRIAGFGGFGDLGTHALDLLVWMLGDVESVTASVQTGTGRYAPCDECGEGMLLFKNGTLGTLAAGWVDVSNPVTLEVCGTEGHAHVVNGELYLQSASIAGADGKQPWRKLPDALPHAFELFLDAIVGKPDVPLVGAREAALRSTVMEAMYEGANQHTWIAPIVLAE